MERGGIKVEMPNRSQDIMKSLERGQLKNKMLGGRRGVECSVKDLRAGHRGQRTKA